MVVQVKGRNLTVDDKIYNALNKKLLGIDEDDLVSYLIAQYTTGNETTNKNGDILKVENFSEPSIDEILTKHSDEELSKALNDALLSIASVCLD